MTNADLKKLAVEIYEGRVYTDRHCGEHMIMNVFMILGLGGLSKMSEDEINDIGLIYEYMDKANPMSVNGQPTFFSMRYLDKRKTKRMWEYYEKYKSLQDEFTKDDPESNAKQGTIDF